MIPNHFLRVLAAVALGGSLAIAADDAYLVPVDRPVKVGQVQNLLIEGDSLFNSETMLNGEELKADKEAWTAVLEGKLEVLAVAPDGDASALNFKVKKLSVTREGKSTEAIKPGSVIKGKRIGTKSEFSVDGAKIDGDLTSVLRGLLPLSNPDEKIRGDEDKAFGTDKPRKVGEHWDVDGKELVATMPPDLPFSVNPEKIKGQMRLVEIVEKDGVKAALIQGEVAMEITGMKNMPGGFKTARGSMTLALDGLFPLDVALPSLREGFNMSVDFSGSMPLANGEGGMSLKTNGRFLTKQKVVP